MIWDPLGKLGGRGLSDSNYDKALTIVEDFKASVGGMSLEDERVMVKLAEKIPPTGTESEMGYLTKLYAIFRGNQDAAAKQEKAYAEAAMQKYVQENMPSSYNDYQVLPDIYAPQIYLGSAYSKLTFHTQPIVSSQAQAAPSQSKEWKEWYGSFTTVQLPPKPSMESLGLATSTPKPEPAPVLEMEIVTPKKRMIVKRAV
jgi:hypothetical protein